MLPVKTFPHKFSDMSIEQYHSCEGVSRSKLMTFKKSPLHYWHEYINPNKPSSEPTPDMIIGNAAHSLILEPSSFWDRYIVRPKHDRRTKVGKSNYDADLMEAGNRIMLLDDQYEKICGMRDSVFDHSVAPSLLQDILAEHSLFWVDEETQLLCKARPDAWRDGMVIDLKTANDASYNAFQRSVYTYGYDIQCGMIHEAIKNYNGEEIKTFAFIVVEKTAPYAIACYQLDGAWLDVGVAKYHDLLSRLKFCMDEDEYPGYPNMIIEMPKWGSDE